MRVNGGEHCWTVNVQTESLDGTSRCLGDRKCLTWEQARAWAEDTLARVRDSGEVALGKDVTLVASVADPDEYVVAWAYVRDDDTVTWDPESWDAE